MRIEREKAIFAISEKWRCGWWGFLVFALLQLEGCSTRASPTGNYGRAKTKRPTTRIATFQR